MPVPMRFLTVLLFVVAGPALIAQPVDTGAVRIATNAPDASLYVDGTPADWTPGELVPLAPGTRTLLLLLGERETWDARHASVVVDVAAGDTLDVAVDLALRYRIESVPYAAEVLLETEDGARTPLGTTPLTLDRAGPIEGTLVVVKRGYAEQRLEPGRALTNTQSVLLRPLQAEAGAEIVGLPDPAPRRWIDVAAGALALAGATAAVYYKLQADDVDDRYRDPFSPERGDPALRDEARRLDTYSAIGLGAMQVGLGVIAVRLVLR